MRRSELYLRDLLAAITRIQRYTAGMDRSAFACSDITVDATVRNLELIGEAVGALSDELKSRHDHVPWRQIRGFRNVLAQRYWVIDLDIVWDVIVNELPGLKVAVEALLEELAAASEP